jgi:hypothetical protein
VYLIVLQCCQLHVKNCVNCTTELQLGQRRLVKSLLCWGVRTCVAPKLFWVSCQAVRPMLAHEEKDMIPSENS